MRGEISPGATRFYDGADWGWHPLWLTGEQVIETCRSRFGVAATAAALLAEGMLNQTWRVTCTDHDRVLRVSRTERTPAQVGYEHTVAAAWAAAVPVVVVAEHDDVPVLEGHALTLYPFIDGVSGLRVSGAERAGQLVPRLAAMHRATLALQLPQRPGFSSVDETPPWLRWEAVRTAIIERFGVGPAVTGPADVIDRAVAELSTQLGEWRRSGRLSVRAAVHGDLNPRNQIYRDGRLVGIIDTDECRVEPLIWDVANVAYSQRDVSPASVWQDYLAAGGPLPPADEELLAPVARIGALTELTWLTDDDGAATHLALRGLTLLAGQLTTGVHRDD